MTIGRCSRSVQGSPVSHQLRQDRERMWPGSNTLARIKYEWSLAEVLYVHDYDESNLLVAEIHVFHQYNLNNDVMQKLQQMQDLCATCGMTPADELNQQTLAVLRMFYFGDDEPKKKLMVYLGTRKERNAHALLAVMEESICRIGLSELAEEEIYQVKPGEEVSSAVLELAHMLEVEQLHLNICQQSW